MEVTRLVSVCLSVLVLAQVIVAHPYRSRDTDTALGDDVTNLAQDLVRCEYSCVTKHHLEKSWRRDAVDKNS